MPETAQVTTIEPTANAAIGIKGVWGVIAQFGAVGALIFVYLINSSSLQGLIKDEFDSNRNDRKEQRELNQRMLIQLEAQSVRLSELGRLLDRIERRHAVDKCPDAGNAPECLRLFPSAFVSMAVAADPKPDIRFPTNPTPPAPIPSPATDEPFVLQPDRLFVVESSVALLVFETPDHAGVIAVSRIEAPKSIFGKFADDPTGRNKLRDFTAKFLYVIEPLAAGGDVQLLLVPRGAESEADAKRIRLRVGAPRPPPDPLPAPKPKPEPKPVTARKLAAVVIEETEDTTAKRSEFFGSAELIARWKAKGHEPPTVADQNIRDGKTKQTPDALKPYVERSKGKSLPQLYLVDSLTRDVVYEGPMPETVADFLKLLDRVGG